jgi:8-oxo-dGTP pyrophosphatase MutT (NUDIX family)
MDYCTEAPALLRAIEHDTLRHPDTAETARLFADFIRRRTDCFSRACAEGHITASAWVLNPPATHVLLTHHRRLGQWFQLGGHLEPDDASVLDAALREAREESGLTSIRALSMEIFDLDRHLIPARPGEPAHFHYDVRYLLQAKQHRAPTASSESKAVEWVALPEVARRNHSESVLRMLRRTPGMQRE